MRHIHTHHMYIICINSEMHTHTHTHTHTCMHTQIAPTILSLSSADSVDFRSISPRYQGYDSSGLGLALLGACEFQYNKLMATTNVFYLQTRDTDNNLSGVRHRMAIACQQCIVLSNCSMFCQKRICEIFPVLLRN